MPTVAGVAAAVLLLLLSLASSGFGGSATSRQSTRSSSRPAEPRDSTGSAAAQTSAASASVMFLGAGKPLPVHDLYGVFRREPTAADIAVEAVARGDGHEDDELGRPLYDQTRLLFGTKTQGVYALPTSADAVCVSNFPNGGAGCGDPGPHGLTVDFDEASGQTPFALYGLVGDDVQSVDFVFADSGLRHAEVRENAYYVQLPGRQAGPDRFILHLRNGLSDVLSSGGTVATTITPIR